jgi:thiol-disulfide isomerase/thioredoxin
MAAMMADGSQAEEDWVAAPAPPCVDRLDATSATIKWDRARGAECYAVAVRVVRGEAAAEPAAEAADGWRTLSETLVGCAVRKKGLDASTKYRFRVRRRAPARGLETPWSAASDVVTPLTAEQQAARPSPPRLHPSSGARAASSLTLTWNAIATTDGAVAGAGAADAGAAGAAEHPDDARYCIQFRPANASPPGDWTTLSDTLKGRAVKKKGLEANTKYEFRVRRAPRPGANNPVPRSDPAVFATWSEPSAPLATLAAQPLNNPFKGLLGESLVMRDGRTVKSIDAALLGKRIVMLYFSASWCPPCRQFTPMLAKFYREMRAAGRSLECVFVSADRDEGSFKTYLAEHHGDWCAIPYGSSSRNNTSAYFKVQGIPRLVVFSGSTGKIVCNNAVGQPLNAAALDGWERAAA